MSEKKLNPPAIESRFVEHPLVQAIGSLNPVSGALSTLWVESLRSRREAELYSFLAEVASRVNELYEKHRSELDVDHIASNEFMTTLANVTEISVREIDEEKRNYLRRFIVNYGRIQRPDVDLCRVFMTFVSELSGMHFLLLEKIFGAQKSLSDADLVVLVEQLDRSEALSVYTLSREIAVESDLVEALCAVLESRGLVIVLGAPSGQRDNTPRIVIRPLARRFMEFMSQ